MLFFDQEQTEIYIFFTPRNLQVFMQPHQIFLDVTLQHRSQAYKRHVDHPSNDVRLALSLATTAVGSRIRRTGSSRTA